MPTGKGVLTSAVAVPPLPRRLVRMLMPAGAGVIDQATGRQ